MGSSGKKRTTMAKLNRESKLRDKRLEKEARKVARKLSAADDAAEAGSGAGGLSAAAVGRDVDTSDGLDARSAVTTSDVAGLGR